MKKSLALFSNLSYLSVSASGVIDNFSRYLKIQNFCEKKIPLSIETTTSG